MGSVVLRAEAGSCGKGRDGEFMTFFSLRSPFLH